MSLDKYRQDFPILKTGIIYFDNACMTLRPTQVIDKITEYYKEFPACTGRSTHTLAQKAEEAILNSRKKVQKFLGAKKSNEIIFTRNTTEAINLIANTLSFKPGDEIITSDREHNSNLLPWQQLTTLKEVKHTIIPSKPDNTFDMGSFEHLISKKTNLVAIVHTSNLDGYTLPVRDIIRVAHDYGAMVLLDGAQSAPHLDLNVSKMGVDFFAMSAHKMCGPSGMGCLYGKYALLEELPPFIVGGDTVNNSTYTSAEFSKPPEKFEAGLQNIAGALGFAAACEYIDKVGKSNIEKHEAKLTEITTNGLIELGAQIVGVSDFSQKCGVISFNIEGMNHHDLALLLNGSRKIALRSGMHCLHSWFNARNIAGSVRASFYFYNTEEEVKIFLEELESIMKTLGP